MTDRRMFTPEGELREEYRELGKESPPGSETGAEPAGETIIQPPGAEPAGPGAAAQGPATPGPATPGATAQGPAPGGTGGPGPAAGAGGTPEGAPVEIPSTGPGPSASFLDLVGVLAEPVPLYLGDAELPDGRSVENLEAARLHIDLLDVLRRKTAGNLTAQESAVLEDVVYRLRMRYVQKRG